MYRRKMIGYEDHLKTNIRTVKKIMRKQRTPSEDAHKPRMVSPKSMYADVAARYKSIDVSKKKPRDVVTQRASEETSKIDKLRKITAQEKKKHQEEARKKRAFDRKMTQQPT